MGRPPCCDKVGVKKGPWTPEEDIILVTYIQEHGPGNWRSVPTKTGLMRCSKSCRLRWTNYLRPGIKRGNFTPHEEGIIIHLQSLLGNRWAAIASYLPRRTDNDIKNYWNTHLKKKIKKLEAAAAAVAAGSPLTCRGYASASKAYDVESARKDAGTVSFPLPAMLHHVTPSSYACSAENISRLLQGWIRGASPKATDDGDRRRHHHRNSSSSSCSNNHIAAGGAAAKQTSQRAEGDASGSCAASMTQEDLESLLSLDNLSGISWEKTAEVEVENSNSGKQPHLSILENWLFEEAAAQVDGLMELSAIAAPIPSSSNDFPINWINQNWVTGKQLMNS